MSEETTQSVWTPPEQYQQVESAVPGVDVFAPIPKTVVPDSPKTYACPNCGATTAYDVAAGGVACEFCGYVAPVHTVHVGRTAEEFEFTLDTVSQSERGWGEKAPDPALRVLRGRTLNPLWCADHHLPLLRFQPCQCHHQPE